MLITGETTVKDLVEANAGVLKVFEKHGVDVPSQCDESIQDCSLELCESMCHIEDIDALVRDLQAFFDGLESK